ncbi:TetR family transcriptional regulator [Nonomuraea antimicrobica]
MSNSSFQRARSPEAKQQRQEAILDAARALATARTVREVTLSDIAEAVGMHKSAMLRYFETREQIYLILTAEGWREWSAHVCERLGAIEGPAAPSVAETLAETLVSRPLFCDLLAQAPLNLERNVSLDAVRDFKLVALAAHHSVALKIQDVLGVGAPPAREIASVATSMAGALWQMAAPGTALRELYRSDPVLSHAIVEVRPRLTGILTALITGFENA